jgi:hypothetical protein
MATDPPDLGRSAGVPGNRNPPASLGHDEPSSLLVSGLHFVGTVKTEARK